MNPLEKLRFLAMVKGKLDLVEPKKSIILEIYEKNKENPDSGIRNLENEGKEVKFTQTENNFESVENGISKEELEKLREEFFKKNPSARPFKYEY